MEWNEKKVKIMDVAERLFAENGYSGTSVREIAKQAEVNVAMISYYFESKEKLLSAILLYRGDYLKSRVDNLLRDETIGVWQKLDFLIDEYVAKFVRNQSLHRIILRESGLHENQYLRQFINERRYEHYKLIRDFVKAGQQSGEFRDDVDLMMLYTLLPGITKHLLFNEDFLKYVVKEETGDEVDLGYLQNRTQKYLKESIRFLLEKK